jgi:hypothetical protein
VASPVLTTSCAGRHLSSQTSDTAPAVTGTIHPLSSLSDPLPLAWLATWPGSNVSPACTPSPIPKSPTLGLTHLQFEARIHAAREPTNPNGFALVVMLGLLDLRIFEATGASIDDMGEEHGYGVLRVHGKGDKVVLIPLPPAVPHHRGGAWSAAEPIIDPFGHELEIGRPLGWTPMAPPDRAARPAT